MSKAAKLCVWVVILVACALGRAQNANPKALTGQVIDQNGQPIPNALVRVCNAATSTGVPCTPTTPIYQDYNLTVPAANPWTTDQYGNFTFYAPQLQNPNLYVVQFSPNSGVTWSYVYNGPPPQPSIIQACNQVGSDAGLQIEAAAAQLPAAGGMVDAQCYGGTNQTIGEQLTALATSTKPVTLLLNPATDFTFTYAFTGTQIAASVATGVSGVTGACLVPIAAGSAILTEGLNQKKTNGGATFSLGPSAATYDVVCNANQDGTQESMLINGLEIVGNPNATMSGSLLHMRLIYVSTLIENVVTYLPFGNAVTDDGGSDHLFIDDNFNDSSPAGGYPGAVVTLNCPTNVTFLGGAIQFNGINNPLIVARAYVPGLSQCPMGSTISGIRFYNTDLELQAATVGTFTGHATDVTPVQIQDPSNFVIDTMPVAGNIGAGQQHLVEISTAGGGGLVRGPLELDNIWYQSYATWQSNGGGSLVHNTIGSPYVSTVQADVFGTKNGSIIGIGKYRWAGNGTSQASETDYEDYKNFTSVTTGSINSVLNPTQFAGADIGVQVNAAGASCNWMCTVKIPAGTFIYTHGIVIPMAQLGQFKLELDQGAVLEWEGTGDAIEAVPPSAGPGVANLRIQGGSLYCQFTCQSSATANGVHIQASSSIFVSDMIINGFGAGHGMWLEGPNAMTISHMIIAGNQVGIFATNTHCTGGTCSPTGSGGVYTPNAIDITGRSVFVGNSQWAVQFYDEFTNASEGAQNDTIEDSVMEPNGGAGSSYGAVSVGMSIGFTLRHVYFEGSPRNFVCGIAGSGGANFGCYGPHITDNFFTIQTTTPYAMELQDTTNALIDGNSTLSVTQGPVGTIVSGTYTSGITATGTTGQSCNLALTGGTGGSGATAYVELTGTNTIAGSSPLVMLNLGSGYTAAPTGGTVSSGSATCTGTAVVSTTIGSNCFINETETVGSYYGRNQVNLIDPNTSASGSLFCHLGASETAQNSASSFTFMNPNYQWYVAYQAYSINTSVTTENVAIQYLTGGGGCKLEPVAGNTTAINNGATSIYARTSTVSALTNGQITLTHPTGNAMTYDIACYNNANGNYGPP